MIEQAKDEVERKHMLKDCDRVIDDLNKWKEEREKKRKESEAIKKEWEDNRPAIVAKEDELFAEAQKRFEIYQNIETPSIKKGSVIQNL